MRALLILNLAGIAGQSVVWGQAVPARPLTAVYTPLTGKERLHNYLHSLVSPESLLRAAVSSGIRHAEDQPEEWPSGAIGYGYRFSDALGQHVVRDTLQYGISAALHEDNRYVASGETGVMRRVKHAVFSTFTARHDDGHASFAFSRVSAAAGTAFISRTWQPPSTNSVSDATSGFAFAMANDAGFNVFREFWPDIKRRLKK